MAQKIKITEQVSGILPVANGGTGASSLGSLSVGTSAVTFALKTASGTVDVSGAATPSTGKVLVASSTSSAIWSNLPAVTMQEADVNGMTEKTTPVSIDSLVIYSAADLGNRKVAASNLDAYVSKGFFGSGTDGSLSVTTGTTSLTATNGYVIKFYENLTVTGGTLDVQGEFNIIYVRDTFTMNGGKISADGRGGAGGVSTTATTGNAGTNGKNLFSSDVFLRGNGGTTPSSGGTGGSQASFPASSVGGLIRVSSGAGGASGAAPTSPVVVAGGAGGAGGGVLIIVANKFNVTGGTISCNGAEGSAGATGSDGGGNAGGGGGGGGGGGTLVLLAKNFISNSGTKTANGGGGGAGGAGSNSRIDGGAGGGGGGGFTVNGGNGGVAGTNGAVGGTNAVGGAGGAAGTGGGTIRSGGGGGGGGGGLVYSQGVIV